MLKTFTLINREDTTTSDTSGTVSFTISDENNDTRIIEGITFLDDNKLAQGVSSQNKRELPLIEGLFRLELNESIEIEFDHYNKLFDRDSDKTANQMAYDKVLEMKKEKKLWYRFTHLLIRPFKKSAKADLA